MKFFKIPAGTKFLILNDKGETGGADPDTTDHETWIPVLKCSSISRTHFFVDLHGSPATRMVFFWDITEVRIIDENGLGDLIWRWKMERRREEQK